MAGAEIIVVLHDGVAWRGSRPSGRHGSATYGDSCRPVGNTSEMSLISGQKSMVSRRALLFPASMDITQSNGFAAFNWKIAALMACLQLNSTTTPTH